MNGRAIHETEPGIDNPTPDNPPPEISQAMAPKPRPFRRFAWLAAVIAVIALLTLLLLSATTPAPRTIVWLSPPEITRALRHGKLRDLKFKLLGMSRSLSKWYQKRRTILVVEIRLIGAHDEPDLFKQFPLESFGDGKGPTAWIMSDEQWSSFTRWLRGEEEQFTNIGQSRITLTDDSQAMISSGSGTNNVTVSIFPRLAHGSLNVLLQAASTLNNATNFAVACRAVIPNGGALIVRGKANDSLSGTNYWFMTSIVAVDAAGNRRKL